MLDFQAATILNWYYAAQNWQGVDTECAIY